MQFGVGEAGKSIFLSPLNGNRSIDETFDARLSAGAKINSLELQEDGIRLRPAGGLVRFNGDGTFDEGFAPSLDPSQAVASIALEGDGHILVLDCEGSVRCEKAHLHLLISSARMTILA